MQDFIDNAAFERFTNQARTYDEVSVKGDDPRLALYNLRKAGPRRAPHSRKEAVAAAGEPVDSPQSPSLPQTLPPEAADPSAPAETEEQKEARLRKLKDDVEKRVKAMSLDALLYELLDQNRLTLTEEEKRLYAMQKKLMLVSRGARADKQEYMNFKDLKRMRREEREKAKAAEEEAREAGLLGVDARGKMVVMLPTDRRSARDITTKAVLPTVAKIARSYADRRGMAHVWDGSRVVDGMPGKTRNGELKLARGTLHKVRTSGGAGRGSRPGREGRKRR